METHVWHWGGVQGLAKTRGIGEISNLDTQDHIEIIKRPSVHLVQEVSKIDKVNTGSIINRIHAPNEVKAGTKCQKILQNQQRYTIINKVNHPSQVNGCTNYEQDLSNNINCKVITKAGGTGERCTYMVPFALTTWNIGRKLAQSNGIFWITKGNLDIPPWIQLSGNLC